jgi:muramoyltetrapeptide carboxypeptidase
MIKPPRLKRGDLIGLVAPASPPRDKEVLARGEAKLEEMGFRVRPGRHLAEKWTYLAGSDEARAADLNEMFADPAVDGIFCIRGGYGAARLLDRLDFSPLRSRPKVFLGYSDITALELALAREIDLVSFYGPMVTTDLISDLDPADRKRLLDIVTRARPPEPIGTGTPEASPSVICSGAASGPLMGGCLSVLMSLLGTPYLPDMTGAILFLEDIDEEPYRLDRYLTQLRLSGLLDGIAGIAIGRLINCEPLKGRSSFTESFRSAEVLQDRLGHLGIPVLADLGFGHGPVKATLPQGIPALLDTDEGVLKILEPAVA